MANELPQNFEEFAEARREGFLRMKELKDKGRQVCGTFCQYTPAEIIHAAGLKQVGLCGRSHLPIKTAETRLPANLCPQKENVRADGGVQAHAGDPSAQRAGL